MNCCNSKFSLTKNASLFFNIISVLVILGLSIGRMIDPYFSTMSIAPIVNTLFHLIAKYAPDNLSDMKALLIEKLNKEPDLDLVSKTCDDIINEVRTLTARTQPSNQTAIVPVSNNEIPTSDDSYVTPHNDSDPYASPQNTYEAIPSARLNTERLPVKLVYNPKTKKLEYEVYEK